MKLTLGQAAKAAKRSKGTLSKALNSGSMSAQKDESGRWQIDPSELSRWMSANPLQNSIHEPLETGVKVSEGSALEVEVKMLREQIETLSLERNRERGQLVEQIEDLRARLDGAEGERTRLHAFLTDQRDRAAVAEHRGFWARLLGKS